MTAATTAATGKNYQSSINKSMVQSQILNMFWKDCYIWVRLLLHHFYYWTHNRLSRHNNSSSSSKHKCSYSRGKHKCSHSRGGTIQTPRTVITVQRYYH